MAQALYGQLTETLLDQLISRLVTYNFGKQKNWGQFQQRKPSADELKLWSEVFGNLVDSGFMDSTIEEDFKHARNTMGLPDREISTQIKASDALKRYYRADQE
jgi:hypothetical protein